MDADVIGIGAILVLGIGAQWLGRALGFPSMQVPVVVITDRALPAGQVTGEITIVSGSLDDKEVSA